MLCGWRIYLFAYELLVTYFIHLHFCKLLTCLKCLFKMLTAENSQSSKIPCGKDRRGKSTAVWTAAQLYVAHHS